MPQSHGRSITITRKAAAADGEAAAAPPVDAHILLAEPRGFCAGVDRAIEIVERALVKFGAPIYVRHEIVHNTYVVNDLKAMKARVVKKFLVYP